MPLSPCRYISGSLDGLCCMESATESEILVLLIFLAPIPNSLTTDRTTASARNADIVTTHERNGYLANKYGSVRVLKESKLLIKPSHSK